MELSGLSPIRRTQILFCVLISLNVLRVLRQHMSFYKWFRASELEISRHRGFGQSACRAFGVLPRPPALSDAQFTLSGIALVGSLLLSCFDVAPRASLLLSLVCYWLYFGQLYCEAHVGAHVIVLIPPMLIVSACSSDLTDAVVSKQTQMLPLLVLKAILTSAYCAAGLSKLWASVKARKFWGNGSTLQYYIFEALMLNRPASPDKQGLPHWSFGVFSPCSYTLQQFLFRSPRLCAVLSVKSLVFEALAPLVLVIPSLGHMFALAGVGFHYGIAVFQNIDFVTWWGPFYALFIWEDHAVTANLSDVVSQSLAEAPLASGLILGYFALHVAGMIYAGCTGAEILPFSSFHMFSEPKNLWSDDSNKFWYFSDKPHATGTLKNYCFPFCRPQHVKADELPRLPFKYLLMCSYRSGQRQLMGNVEVSDKMQAVVDKIYEAWDRPPASYMDQQCISNMLQLRSAAKQEFSQAQQCKHLVSAPQPRSAAAASG